MRDYSCFLDPEKQLPHFCPTSADKAFLDCLVRTIRVGEEQGVDAQSVDSGFNETGFPRQFERLILILYAPGHKRVVVSRLGRRSDYKFSDAFRVLMAHPRTRELAESAFKLQMDFVVEPPVSVDLYAVGTQQAGKDHFEIGIDGLIFRGKDQQVHIFPPGDGYVRSVMSMRQLREYLNNVHGEEYIRSASFHRFRSNSYLSGMENWLHLYRGYPVVGALTKTKLEHVVELAFGHIKRTQEESGKFLYYYDAALDSRRDHEHPNRDVLKNPYYNILRHSGGALTCIFYERYFRNGESIENTRRAINYQISQTRSYICNGREAAYVYSERKSKLGGAGLALYMLAEYQLVTGDKQYLEWASKIAWHLINQVTASGEFIYYNIYLDKPIGEQENQNYFSFYYPGEAVCGMARYYHIADAEDKRIILEKLNKALEFLLEERPRTRSEHYTAVPSDAWLMMGIKELWDIEEMRKPAYAEFVFSDAQKMIDQMYKVTDAPYPDYAGAFYYSYGDYPYADGARCEGLLGAYELAIAMGNRDKAEQIWPALRLAAWAVMHLVNTEDAIYFARNPAISLGGIRFKYTRQWFRIDTIQHVASFYAKLLPHWEKSEQY